MKVESDGLSLTFGHTSMTIFPQLAHKPSFQPTFLFKKEKEINFGWKKWFVAWSWALRTFNFFSTSANDYFLLKRKQKEMLAEGNEILSEVALALAYDYKTKGTSGRPKRKEELQDDPRF